MRIDGVVGGRLTAEAPSKPVWPLCRKRRCQAKVGDRAFHGYYSSILTSESGQPKIIEEAVVVAAP